MALPSNLNDREQQKFEDIAPGQTAVRVTGTNFSGSFRPAGLTLGGKVTKVQLNSTTWTALPPTPLPNRNALSLQNQSNIQLKIDFTDTNPLYEGIIVNPNGERFFAITDQIFVYAKSSSGTPDIFVEELA